MDARMCLYMVGWGGGEKESAEPIKGLNPRILRSRPEQKSDA